MEKRRPEILEDYDREVYGRVPANVPKVSWTVKYTDPEYLGFTPIIANNWLGMLTIQLTH